MRENLWNSLFFFPPPVVGSKSWVFWVLFGAWFMRLGGRKIGNGNVVETRGRNNRMADCFTPTFFVLFFLLFSLFVWFWYVFILLFARWEALGNGVGISRLFFLLLLFNNFKFFSFSSFREGERVGVDSEPDGLGLTILSLNWCN